MNGWTVLTQKYRKMNCNCGKVNDENKYEIKILHTENSKKYILNKQTKCHVMHN